MTEETATARIILGVRGMDTEEAEDKVRVTLEALIGIEAVETVEDGQATVSYDPSALTIMDLVRALRKIGFLSGME